MFKRIVVIVLTAMFLVLIVVACSPKDVKAEMPKGSAQFEFMGEPDTSYYRNIRVYKMTDGDQICYLLLAANGKGIDCIDK